MVAKFAIKEAIVMRTQNAVSNKCLVVLPGNSMPKYARALSFFKASTFWGWLTFLAAYGLISILVLSPDRFL
jgi:hypothetical protein